MMSLRLLLCWVALLAGNNAVAQSPGSLAAYLRTADQVIVISHQDLWGRVDSAGNDVPAPSLLRNGRPNLAVVVKSKTLTSAERAWLGTILTRPFKPGAVTVMHCCQPHHTIFLVSKSQTAWLDICLGCRCLQSSWYLKLPDFDNRRWEELNKFVDQIGLRYSEF